MPVLVTGTIQSPNVEPDVSAMAKMRVQGAFAQAGANASGALGALTGKTFPERRPAISRKMETRAKMQ